MDKLSIVKKQFEVLKGDSRVVAVILFGSHAIGTPRPLSDIDICVIPAKDVLPHELIKITPCVDADVSYFYSLPLHMQKKVLSGGKPLFINNLSAFTEARSRTTLAYLDFNPLRERLIKSMLAQGVFG